MAGSSVFDLRTAREQDGVPGHLVTQGILGLFGGALGFYVIYNLTLGWVRFHQSVNLQVATLVAALFLGLSTWAVFAFAPGPVSMSIDSNTLLLRYRSGRNRRLNLDRPDLRVTLWTFPEFGSDGRPNPPPRHFLVGGLPFRNPITPEAYDSLITTAKSMGLAIDVLQSGSISGVRTRVMIHRRPS